MSGKRLQKMFHDLVLKDKVEREKARNEEQRRARNPDLEDGEIASDREDHRAHASRDPYRDDRREERRAEVDRREDSAKRRNYYDGSDRLNFHRHRPTSASGGPLSAGLDRGSGGPLRSSQWPGRSPTARHSPY